MRKLILVLAVASIISLLMVGCAGSPIKISMMTPEELRFENSVNLGNAYAFNRSEKAKAELIRRGEITDREWELIEKRKISMGMSELALVCSWGYPKLYGGVNKTVGKWGVHKQWIYTACNTCKSQYVYTENGKVTSWQN